MRINETENKHKLSLDAHDIKCVIDGLVNIAQDTILRDIEFDRSKVCVFASILKDVSRTLDGMADRAEALERGQL